MTIEERIERAGELRKQGYNCAQTVIMAFPDVTGMSDETAARMAMALGSGVAATGEICGVANGMAIVTGLAGKSDPNEKGASCRRAAKPIADFACQNSGCLACRDLKGKLGKPCDQLIFEGIEILHNAHEK